MNKKDIALSIGGILASLTLAYLLWRVSQKDAAANAAQSDANAQAAAASQQAQYDASTAYTYSQQSSLSVPTIDTTNDASTDSTSSGDGSADATFDNLLTGIISDFAGAINSPVAGAQNNASIIPTLPSPQGVDVSNIAQTAQDAQDQVNGDLASISTITPVANGSAPSQPVSSGVVATPVVAPTTYTQVAQVIAQVLNK